MRIFREHPSLIVALVVLLALFALSVHSFSRWNRTFYSGTITGLDSINVVLSSPEGKTVRLRTSPKTHIRLGRGAASLELGQIVLVTGAMNHDGVVDATDIRVIDDTLPLPH